MHGGVGLDLQGGRVLRLLRLQPQSVLVLVVLLDLVQVVRGHLGGLLAQQVHFVEARVAEVRRTASVLDGCVRWCEHRRDAGRSFRFQIDAQTRCKIY